MFLRNAWYVAGWDAEVAGDTLLPRRLLGDDLVFFRGDDGAIVALEDRCCHRHAPLSKGQREGNRVRCMYHGLVFDASGRCVEVPGQERVPERLCVRSYPVVERDRLIWVWMGLPENAAAAAIPDAHWHDCANWSAERGGYIHYDSNVQLIADNLLDFSHLGFVHNKSIGTRKQGSVRPEVTFDDESVTVRFTTPDSPPPPFARELGALAERVDRFNFYVWHVRGNYFVQDSVIAPVGEGYESADPSTIKLHTFIALTPRDAQSTHYFWSTAHNDFRSTAPDLTRRLTAQVAHAFHEDREIIEAQQRSIAAAPGAPMAAIAADGTLLRVRRMLDAMLSREAQASHAPPAAEGALA
ncbi:aromatic ring-hydroxylating dioxygenase subunit alpha [Paraburkholderia unamae]|uniref:aromatic ring-hydroxylating dioxygenase subunit alpha n=1 Tax=Paraburkholderia unamae TaxID=219649 RepID=UPI000DD2C2FC|nr:aromatic ring-hydroxylating dioxygenase subunit alpha [Paraburkholderia unamae]